MATYAPAAPLAGARPAPALKDVRGVIFAASLGTVFEWYDFYLYGSLAAIISKQFFSGVNPTAGFVFALLAFAAGFAVRPFGAVVFGRLGDLVGRKYTFLVTILIMGFSTSLVGVLPSYASIGVVAPVALVTLRLLQGLALGGEYGGAATYVAEHATEGKRGQTTAWIQTTATLGLFLSLLVILACRVVLKERFDVWGWRIPFLVSLVLLAISTWIRLRLHESPMFQQMKAEGKGSTSPIRDSFGNWPNLKLVLLALFGLAAGQAVVWYTGQFYALFFLTQMLKVDAQPANLMVAAALLLATPFFILMGALSDRIGRKPVILGGCLVAALTYFPLFKALTHYANPALEQAQASAPVTVVADPNECSFQFNPVGTTKFTSSCDVAKAALVKAGVPYRNRAAPAGTTASVAVGSAAPLASYSGGAPNAKHLDSAFTKSLGGALKAAGYPAKADPARVNTPMVVAILFVLVFYVTMVYGPIAAMLVEMFPTRIRYTSMSLPYHIGNGWFGGFLPTTAFAIVAATGDLYSGLWYPIVIAGVTLVIGALFVRETRGVDIRG
jgi:MFS family permease